MFPSEVGSFQTNSGRDGKRLRRQVLPTAPSPTITHLTFCIIDMAARRPARQGRRAPKFLGAPHVVQTGGDAAREVSERGRRLPKQAPLSGRQVPPRYLSPCVQVGAPEHSRFQAPSFVKQRQRGDFESWRTLREDAAQASASSHTRAQGDMGMLCAGACAFGLGTGTLFSI